MVIKGEKNNKAKNILRFVWLFYGLASIGVIVFLLNLLVCSGKDLVAPKILLQENWNINAKGQDYHDVNLEVFRIHNLKKGDTLSLETQLPESWEFAAPALCIPIKQTVIDVYVEDELIYQYGHERFQNNENIGNGLRFVHLKEDSAGKKLRIEMKVGEDNAFVSVSSVWVADWQDAYRYVITENRIPFLLGTFLFVFGVVMALLLVVAIAHEFRYWDFLFISLFSLCMGLWTLCYNDVMVIVALPLYTITLIQNMALLFAPLTIVGHMYVYVKKLKQPKVTYVYYGLLLVQAVFTVIVIILHAFDLLHSSESIKFQYILFGFLVVYFAYLLVASAKKNKDYKVLYYIGMLIVQITIMYELLTYALARYAGLGFLRMKGISAFGIIAFVAVILLDLYRDISIRQLEAKEKEFLLRRAYTDELTKVRNRSYCSEYMDSLQTEHVKDFTIFSLDINNLKQTNDTYGHSVGDSLIRRAAKLLEETFRERGIIGRMGGDEFIVIIPISDKRAIENLIEKFKEFVVEENQENDNVELSIAYGYAISTETENANVEEIYKLADNRMYECKRSMKIKNKEKA